MTTQKIQDKKIEELNADDLSDITGGFDEIVISVRKDSGEAHLDYVKKQKGKAYLDGAGNHVRSGIADVDSGK